MGIAECMKAIKKARSRVCATDRYINDDGRIGEVAFDFFSMRINHYSEEGNLIAIFKKKFTKL
jgi:hypothetical protein